MRSESARWNSRASDPQAARSSKSSVAASSRCTCLRRREAQPRVRGNSASGAYPLWTSIRRVLHLGRRDNGSHPIWAHIANRVQVALPGRAWLPSADTFCSTVKACAFSYSTRRIRCTQRGAGQNLFYCVGFTQMRYCLCPTFQRAEFATGLKIIPSRALPFMTTRSGSWKRRWRTHPDSSSAVWAVNHSQSTEPSPASGLTVK